MSAPTVAGGPTVLSLFAGIGGLDLGLERAGMRVVGQVEIDPFCRTVLARHWPEVPRHDDVRTAPAWWTGSTAGSGAGTGAVRAARPAVDVVAGGFPCQPFSNLGLGLGTADPRWGWPWMRDVVRLVGPRYVLIENVADLVRDRRAFGTVLGELSDLGFDACWTVLPACALGAPHTRPRVLVVAHPPGDDGEQPVHLPAAVPAGRPRPGAAGRDARADRWLPEPDVGRVAHGLPKRLVAAHLRALGNAVVPAVAEHAGRLITRDITGDLGRGTGAR